MIKDTDFNRLINDESTSEIFKKFCESRILDLCDKKRITNLILYDHVSFYKEEDISDRLIKIKELKRDSTSLKSFLTRYGEKKGTELYEERIKNLSFKSTLDFFIEKYGKIEGTEKYKEVNKKKASVSLPLMKEKYGDKEGEMRWNMYLDKKRKSYTKEWFIEKYGANGESKYENFKEIWKKSNTLENFIRKYGKEKGEELWKNKNIEKGKKNTKSYIKENYSDYESEFSKRYGGTSLERMILKYGEDEGKKRYEQKVEKNRYSSSNKSIIDLYGEEKGNIIIEGKRKKRNSTLAKNGTFHSGNYSKCSQELFFTLHFFLKEYYNQENIPVKYALYGKELFLWSNSINDNTIYFYDFSFEKKIIEFHGDYFHCNPNLYSEEYFNTKKGLYAYQIWEIDEIKKRVAIDKGYQYLTIWQKEYSDNKTKIEKICKDFLTT
jgi:hypothetical protein